MITTLVALGGVAWFGYLLVMVSELVNHWLSRIAKSHYQRFQVKTFAEKEEGTTVLLLVPSPHTTMYKLLTKTCPYMVPEGINGVEGAVTQSKGMLFVALVFNCLWIVIVSAACWASGKISVSAYVSPNRGDR